MLSLWQLHRWVTENGASPLPLEEEHCTVIEVTEEEVKNSVKLIPSLSAVVSQPYRSTKSNTSSVFELAKVRFVGRVCRPGLSACYVKVSSHY